MVLSTSKKIMIFVLVAFISLVSCQCEFYIKPSLSDACSERVQCLTLSQFTARNIYSNVTLKFYPGNHTLTSTLTFQSNLMVRILKKSNHTANSMIQCTHSGRIDLNNTELASIYNMEFKNCPLQVNHTYHVDIINSTFLQLFNSYYGQFQRVYLGSFWGYGHVGVIVSQASNVTLFGVSFERNRAEFGAAIFAVDSAIAVRYSSFKNNQALCAARSTSVCLGGVLYSYNSTITIQFGNFQYNSVIGGHGGVFALFESLVSICNSYFASNVATVGDGGVIYAQTTYLNITTSSFLLNRAALSGGAIQSIEGMFVDSNGHYEGNTAGFEGGAMHLEKATLKFTESRLLFNNAQYSGGAVSVYFGTQHFYECEIFGNIAGKGGSAISVISVHLYVSNCNFTANTVIEKDYYGTIRATYSKKISISDSVFSGSKGGVLSLQDAYIIYIHNTIFSNNTGSFGIIYFIESTCIVSGFSEFMTNIGSIFAYNSNVTIAGNATFINSYSLSTNRTTFSEGGVITAFQSEIILSGLCNLKHNFAESGGAVYAIESQVYITGNTTLSHNIAEKNGGAIFLYQSQLECQDDGKLLFLGNIAGERGGAIHAISSSIRTTFITKDYTQFSHISQIIFTENYAIKGGAVSLEVNAKLYIFINTYKY